MDLRGPRRCCKYLILSSVALAGPRSAKLLDDLLKCLLNHLCPAKRDFSENFLLNKRSLKFTRSIELSLSRASLSF